MLKNGNDWMWSCDMKRFGGDLKKFMRLKTITCWPSVISVTHMGVKIHENIVLVTSIILINDFSIKVNRRFSPQNKKICYIAIHLSMLY